jgi:polyisoprenoid-binding protein YceI
MALQGSRTLGPDNARLSVRTGRTGAAAKAGHDLLIEVTSWSATLELGDDRAQASVALDADSTSLRVLEGTGGMQSLGDKDKASIRQTIDDEVLKGRDIAFRSTEVHAPAAGGPISVRGELTLAGSSHPIAFDLLVGDDDGELRASAVLKQSDWGIKPYSTLFGALKVADEVSVTLEPRPR